MKVKHILIVFLVGIAVMVVGSLFKVMHWPTASILLTVGTMVTFLSIILAILKLSFSKNLNSLLNS